MLILGIIFGLLTGVIIGLTLSFPLGSAVGIIIDRFFGGWALEIELILVLLSVVVIFKILHVKWKHS